MDVLDKAIIATIAYYAALGRPLCAADVWERLIPPMRFGSSCSPSLGDVVARLDSLIGVGTLECHRGHYGISGMSERIVERYLIEERITAVTFRRFRASTWWLQAVPFVRCICASGSLALSTADDASDWDAFLIVASGRLYTARTALLMFAFGMRKLRTKNSVDVRDRFCFNHYVTADGMSIRHRSLFTAQTLAWMVPLHDPLSILERFWQANHWIGQYSMRVSGPTGPMQDVPHSKMLSVVRRTFEFILSGFFGSLLERMLRAWQQRRIRREPATYERGGRVVADDRELEFHPRSFEAVALARYNAALSKLGMGMHREHDSGLL